MASFFAAKPPPLCLPHWGRGTAPAVDRVLSYIVDLRRISSLFFMPLVPYPARSARHLPHAGKALSVVILFLHISCIRFDNARIAMLSYHSLPHWGRGTAQRRSGALVNDALGTIFPALFHTASTLSGSLRSPPSPRGEGCVSGIAVSPYRCLPHWGRGTASAVDRVLSYIVDLRRIPSLSFIPLVPYPARSARHLPLEGKALFRRYSFSTHACIRSDNARIAASSFRSLPKV